MALTARRRGLHPRAALGALIALLSLGAATATAAPSASSDWAKPDIAQVTKLRLLGRSPLTFDPQALLTQGTLSAALARIEAHHLTAVLPAGTTALPAVTAPTTPTAPQAIPAAAPTAAVVLSTLTDGATVPSLTGWTVSMENGTIARVSFSVDGVRRATVTGAPFTFAPAAGAPTLTDGRHQLAVTATTIDGSTYIAVWHLTVAAGAPATSATPGPVPVSHVTAQASPLRASTRILATSALTVPATPTTTTPFPTTPSTTATASSPLFTATSPSSPVTIKQLDAALVDFLDLGTAAAQIQRTLTKAGLNPPPNTGTEAVARLLGLRYNHPASQDSLEELPDQSATRAEAAYSIAHLLRVDQANTDWVRTVAASFTLPTFTTWQRAILTTAVSYVGFPYVWGGSSPTTETPFGQTAPGGFDCSGFVWRVYKLTSYPGERTLADTLKGRTTYVMSGEVPRSERIPQSKLEPGDVMFFGVGPKSTPQQVDHTAIYLGGGWFIQSSDEGVTILPFSGYAVSSFAWARRPLREAGLAP